MGSPTVAHKGRYVLHEGNQLQTKIDFLEDSTLRVIQKALERAESEHGPALLKVPTHD